MRLTVIGSSPAWPNPGGAHSGYLVEGSGRLLLDCGPGVLGRLLQQEEGWPRIDAIAITHFHLDHFGDLVPWVWGGRYGPGADLAKPELFVPPGGADLLEEIGIRVGTPGMFACAFEISEYVDDTTFSAGGYDVTPTRVPHYTMRSYAFRLTDGATVLAYSGDSAPDDALAEVARDADLFLCEATLLDVEPEPRGHLSLDEAHLAFMSSGAQRLLVTHRPHEYPRVANVEIAYDGLVVDIS